MTNKPVHPVGTRVTLAPSQSCPSQRAVIEAYDEVMNSYTVCVEVQDRQPDDSDGIQIVDAEYVQPRGKDPKIRVGRAVSTFNVQSARDNYARFVQLCDEGMDEADFWGQLTGLTLAALSPDATPRMQAVAELLVRADYKFNGHPLKEDMA